MSYINKQSAKDSGQTQPFAKAPTVSVFADQRASTAVQLKQQQIMRSTHSPNLIQVDPKKEQRSIQLFSIDNRNSHIVTDDGHYRMDQTKPDTLLAHHGVTGPQPGNFFQIVGTEFVKNAKGINVKFQKYKAKSNLADPTWAYLGPQIIGGNHFQIWQSQYLPYDGPNDCGMYATGVAKNNQDWGKKILSQKWNGVRWENQPEVFDSYGSLKPVANSKRDKEIKPKPKDVLVIEPPVGSISGVAGTSKYFYRCNFHAAPVVITTGSDYITNEADAGDAGRLKPYWKISGSQNVGQSWHDSYKDAYKDSRRKRQRMGLNPNNVWPTTKLLEK